jgi:uncharacterized protein (UPF0332 family)
MNIDECIEKGLLKKDIADGRKALRSITVAKNKLSKANKLKEAGFEEDAILNAYSAMFHAARALLFLDGFREKSHYALLVYLKEKYRTKLEPRFINELDSLRLERHEILYSLDTVKISKTEVQDIISIANDFISSMEKLVLERR